MPRGTKKEKLAITGTPGAGRVRRLAPLLAGKPSLHRTIRTRNQATE